MSQSKWTVQGKRARLMLVKLGIVMKIARYAYLLLLSLLTFVARTGDAANIAQTEPPIQTDKQAYSVTRASRFIPAKGNHAGSVAPVIKVAIGVSYTNRTRATVYLPTCITPSQPALEKKVKGEWVVAFAWGERLCLGEPVRIEPGTTYQDVFHVEASLTDNDSDSSRLRVREIAGTYRLVRRFYKTDPRTWASGGYGRNVSLSQLLPLRERISNEFKLTE
jgi:hypothetical protein